MLLLARDQEIKDANLLDQIRSLQSLANIGIGELRAGCSAEAVSTLRHALTRSQRLLGYGHPSIGVVNSYLGKVLLSLNCCDEAESHLLDALCIREATMPSGSAVIADSVLD